MIIVQGTGRVDPAQRDLFIAQRAEAMRISRAEPGNLEYVIAADPIDVGRVIVSERWATEEDLAKHGREAAERRSQAETDEGTQVAAEFEVTVFEVANARALH